MQPFALIFITEKIGEILGALSFSHIFIIEELKRAAAKMFIKEYFYFLIVILRIVV